MNQKFNKTRNKMKPPICKTDMIKIFLESINAVNPARLVAENLKLLENKLIVCDKCYDIRRGNIYLVGFGKAVLGMASQCEKILGNHLLKGVICVPEGTTNTFLNNKDFHLKSNSVIEVFEGAKNNMPDEIAEQGADAIISLVSSMSNENDALITLISGGGSALFPKPLPGITLKEKLNIITLLTSSGANINELNTVRKKISQVKGGGLARLSHPHQTISLILSDVLNDSLDIIASGPTVPNTDEPTAALEIFKKYSITQKISTNILKIIQQNDTSSNHLIKMHNYSHVDNYLIGNNRKVLNSAKYSAEGLGYTPVILTCQVNGFVTNVANFYKDLLSHIIKYYENSNVIEFEVALMKLQKTCSFPWEENFYSTLFKTITTESGNGKKICIIAGGETTVKLKGNGKGGRNQELALLVATKLNELKLEYFKFFEKHNVLFLSAGTDGIDGPTDVAGALVDFRVCSEAEKMNLSVPDHLVNNDSYHFFSKFHEGSCFIKTGHTGTNVADVHFLNVYERFD